MVTVDADWFLHLVGRARRGEYVRVAARLSENQACQLLEQMKAAASKATLTLRRSEYDEEWLLINYLKYGVWLRTYN